VCEQSACAKSKAASDVIQYMYPTAAINDELEFIRRLEYPLNVFIRRRALTPLMFLPACNHARARSSCVSLLCLRCTAPRVLADPPTSAGIAAGASLILTVFMSVDSRFCATAPTPPLPAAAQ